MITTYTDIQGYNGRYKISLCGDIKCCTILKGRRKKTNIPKEVSIKQKRGPNNYVHISMFTNGKPKQYLLHRIIAQVFIPNPETKPQINHINGIKWDNRIENLEWCTQSENMQHAYKTGLKKGYSVNPFKKGEGHTLSKLKNEDVVQIRILASQGMQQRKIGKKFGVCQKTILNILKKRIWTHV